ncbi:ATP-binding protein [Streptomyces sp. 8N616]|uniref:ATP-binding protein n=1 Tax=Streptomyces sp. 8N616 TaxID=3457414 RepID=UPI003FD0E590
MHPTTTHDQATEQRWKMQFASNPKCVSLARRLVGKTLTSWGYSSDDVLRVILVCSELATNAVLHARKPGHLFEMCLTADGANCLVEVSDASGRPPRPVDSHTDDEHGRGLQLVASLTEETGHHPRTPIGKTVWARLHLGAPDGDPGA